MAAAKAQTQPAPSKKTPEEKHENIITALAKYQKQIEKVVPRYITPDRMLRLVTGEINRTPLLKACTVMSIINGVVTAASMGVGIGPRMAYLVPFRVWKAGPGGKRYQCYEATLMIDYRSKITLAKRCGIIIRPPQLVFPGDEFEAQYDNGALVIHHVRGKGKHSESYIYREDLDYKIKDGSERWKKRLAAGFAQEPNYTHAYVFWRDGEEVLGEMMDRDQLDAIRKRSKAGNDGPWITDAGQMARKTVIHRAFNYMPFDPEQSAGEAALRSQEVDATFSGGEHLPLLIEPESPTDETSVVDGDFVPLDDQETAMPQRASESNGGNGGSEGREPGDLTPEEMQEIQRAQIAKEEREAQRKK